MYNTSGRRDFPDFFSEKGPLRIKVTPLNFNSSIYWMSSLATEETNSSQDAKALQQHQYLKPYDDNDIGLVDCEDIDENYDIVLTKSGKFTTSLYVPSSLLSYIIGAKASRLKNLERTTNTQIKVPRPNEKGNVKITGETERNVASARTQISMIVMQKKDKLPISHFVSIPMMSDQITLKLKDFKKNILTKPARGITESLFQNPEKIHLTISTLTLVDDEEVDTAKKVLRTCYEEYVSKLFNKDKSYKIHLRGLEIMNDDPTSVNVLYGCIHMDTQDQNVDLQNTSDTIAEYFYKSGLSRKQYDRVKLHVTLMNSTFRRPDEKQESFDAVDILNNYKDYYFGSVDFKNIHLSIRFTGKHDYYEAAMVINIGK